MKKLLIVLLILLPSICFGQTKKVVMFNGKIYVFNSKIDIDTTPIDTVITSIGDGESIGDGDVIGDEVYFIIDKNKLNEYYIKNEEIYLS